MEQLLQRIQTNYEMAKDEESRRMIIVLLRFASDAIQDLTKGETIQKKTVYNFGKRVTEGLSDGSLNPDDWS
jgi:hypothetical protein